jgi:Na+-transporting NADH:ubiquinone oxidoreductase subunit B
MQFLRKKLDEVKPLFEKGGKYEKWYFIFEANETFLFSPKETTKSKGAQIRDAMDMKRLMITVVIAMVPCLIFGMINVGRQHFLATGQEADLLAELWIGIQRVLPIVVVSYVVGLGLEFGIATIRRHPINEGFLVTGMLIPLIMPPTIPLWQVAMATAFAVILGKEAFGGTGMNVLNVALTARAFLYFAYPTDMSGDVWVYKGGEQMVDGYTGATPLSIGAEVVGGSESMLQSMAGYGTGWADGLFSFGNLMMGWIPGSIGETSLYMCLIGAAILVLTGTGSWKIIVGVFGGAFVMGAIMNLMGTNLYMDLPAHYHLVIGGLAFGAVFMATDPVTAAQTEIGKWYYGILIGVMTVIIRVWNPAYPEGIMMAILLMNVFAPLIDYFVLNANKKRRLSRATV